MKYRNVCVCVYMCDMLSHRLRLKEESYICAKKKNCVRYNICYDFSLQDTMCLY